MPELSSRPLLNTGLDRPLFADRERELTTLQRSVESGLNALVLGERGAGKTSLLHRLSSVLEEARFQPVFLDGARTASGPVELLSLLIFAVEPDHAESAARNQAFMDATKPLISRSFLDDAQVREAAAAIRRSTPSHNTERLLRALRELEDALRQCERQVVLIIDEPPSAEDAYTLFGRLRDELWRLPATWVLAGDADEEATYLRGPASAFFETVLRLDPLSDQAATELLTKRTHDVKLPRPLRDEIVAQADGNPRRLVNLARDAIFTGKHAEQLSAERQKRDRLQGELGQAARRLIAELEAHGPASASDERLLARMGWTRSRATQVFRELERAGAVRNSLERSGSARPRKVYEIVSDKPSKARS